LKCLVGIDDTDSWSGFCTTYLAFKIASQSSGGGFQVFGYPRLVRLNPNIPFKTRGNAAVCLPLETDDVTGTFRFVCSIVERLSDVKNGANTGVVLLRGARKLPFFTSVYHAALSGVVSKEKVARILRDNGVLTHQLGNGMGLVGAAASIAFDESYDHTYELIAYRRREFWGTRRRFDPTSVQVMDQRTSPDTFNNYDYQKVRPLVAPHGPDPVFLGVRGSTPGTVLRAFQILRYDEDLEGHMIYLTNQGTDAHLERELELPLKAYSSGWVEGEIVSARPGPGGHQYIRIISRGAEVDCAVYEPTGDLNRSARLLISGDRVRVMGGVRRPSTQHGKLVNAESIEVLSLAPEWKLSNPRCRNCGLRMKSEGRAKGFECQRCGWRTTEGAKRSRRVPRKLHTGRYLSSPRAHRHLTKPLIRYGREAAEEVYPLIDGWLRSSISVPELARSL
jgi:tRNA(Ile2)-agmatinylcytidine synthase